MVKYWSILSLCVHVSEKAGAEKALITAIAKALEAVNSSDAKGWFESCGYTNAIN